MGRVLSLLILILFLPRPARALPENVSNIIKLKEAFHFFDKQTLSPKKVKIAVHDVSFFGHKILLKEQLTLKERVAPLTLVSPHGVSVAQILLKAADERPHISLLTKGIYLEDFQRARKLWQKNDIKLVNLSMRLRDQPIVDEVNSFIKEGGIVIASSGNGAERFGRDVAPHYSDYQGILIGASNTAGEIESFSYFKEGATLLAPGSKELYPVNVLRYNIAPREEPQHLNEGLSINEHLFGMTSAAAPVVSGVVALALRLNPELTQKQVNLLLMSSSNLIEGRAVFDAHKFLRYVVIHKRFKNFYFEGYRPLMCSHNVYDFIQELLKENLIKRGESQVLHLRKRMAPFAAIFPVQARNNQKSWSFHAFFTLNNLVFDFDFKNSPTIETLEDYRSLMWPSDTHILRQAKESFDYKLSDLDGEMNTTRYPLEYWQKSP